MNILLCCIAKNENLYIREWIEYYYNMGFTNIVICDNNDIDGEHFEDVINDYIESGFVIIENYRNKKGVVNYSNNPSKTFYSIQIDAYNNIYKKYGEKYDWIAFFDCDEFLTIENDTLHSYINKIPNKYNIIKFNWLYYDDNNLVNYSPEPVQVRFTHSNPNAHGSGDNKLIKSIVKTKLNILINSAHINSPHGINCSENCKVLKACNALFNGTTRFTTIVPPIHNVAYIKHYRYKTIEEYINKIKRGYPDDYPIDVNRFFKINSKTQDKIDILNKYVGK